MIVTNNHNAPIGKGYYFAKRGDVLLRMYKSISNRGANILSVLTLPIFKNFYAAFGNSTKAGIQ
jgi:hypothetical protein